MQPKKIIPLDPALPLRDDTPVNVTRSYLPPLEEYQAYLRQIWSSNQLTNRGQLVQDLEGKLAERLAVPHVLCVANGTMALQLAIDALDLRGDIVTTPFSYVATTSAILWQNCRPVFADIEADSLCIDPAAVEAAITDNSCAILATHVFGTPCDIERLGAIARRHKLPLIFDAAHAFGVEYQGRPLASYGDIATLSFHATKLMHTVEGGAVLTHSPQVRERLQLSHAFGHSGDEHSCLGINAKMSELHAAMGLALWPHLPEIRAARQRVHGYYERGLMGARTIRRPLWRDAARRNFAYYPVILRSESAVQAVLQRLADEHIHPRRYFYPSLNRLPYVAGDACPISEDIARRIICLPMAHDLRRQQLQAIVAGLLEAGD